ncbi:aminobutyraldehyde dehydrogenase [Antrihabitans sp. YC2-6]|uniref:aminobutyraldehyde dehydrogenase n=1 Tax=Antrihabitans sp. YC2-6 TaxID=2799498 RepID=UPI0018F41157|nr:aminobutyraldehyde dehydrogenase [Antrihabitans sp. YC2-6]MBJ8344324.1 aminobutyraldehyde dehydrogenase [Antrihabitans sp. YC2-6]
MTRTIQNVIDGKSVDAASGRTTDLIDPCTGELFGTAALSSDLDVDAAYESAAAAFELWKTVSPRERQALLLQIADAVEAAAEELIAAESQNTGKPIALLRADELPDAVDQIRFFAGASRVLEGLSAGEYTSGHTSYIRREPIGVIGQVAPWNYPLLEAVGKFAPAIAAGNTVVLKPSDTTPVSTVLLASIAAEFLPPGVLNVVCGDRDTGRAVVSHPTAQMVAITGSVRAGFEVARTAADDAKRAHLELGGKSPVIVFADADLDSAATTIAEAGYYNAGQDCTAATRVLVAESVADDFAARLAERARETKVGSPTDPDVFCGPLNNANQLAQVSGFVERTPGHAAVLAGGTQLGTRGYFWAPTVIAGLRQDDEMSQNEIFGPVITIQTFSDEADAVRSANDVRFGLASSVWTTDNSTAMRVSSRLDFGTVWVNCHTVNVSEMPHGGFKHSGYGKNLSMYALDDYTRIKHVMHNIAP